jgi:hypothetical protein
MLNTNSVPDYMKQAKMNLTVKTGRTDAKLNELRLLAILSHLTKVLEKAVKTNLKKIQSDFWKQVITKQDLNRTCQRRSTYHKY